MSEHAFHAEATIAAPPRVVWDILIDADRYSSWDSGVIDVEGHIGAGETITVHASVNPGRAFPVKVTAFEPPSKMTWTGGMPFGLFVGERTFSLTATEDGGTAFTVSEEYHGPLTTMMWHSMPDLQPSFAQFATGLKAQAESHAASAI